jgi:DNA repair protein RadC
MQIRRFDRRASMTSLGGATAALVHRRHAQQRYSRGPVQRRWVEAGSLQCASILTPLLVDRPAEAFAILCLSTKREIIAYHEVSRGSLDATIVHPREVFKDAFLCNAASIVIVHYVARHIMSVMCPGSLCGGAALALRFSDAVS